MTTSQKRDIDRRTFGFAVRILNLVKALPRDLAGQVVARQVARSGTSVGANVEEAQGAQTRVEIARKMNIALSESREAWYWLRLIAAAEIMKPSRMTDITNEANEIVKILTTIVKKTRNNTGTRSQLRKR